MNIYSFISPIAEANTYCLIHNDECLMIDAVRSDELYTFLLENGIKKITVLLTHGHYDHVLGILDLRNEFELMIVSSEKGPELLGNTRKNLSAVANLIGSFRGSNNHIEPFTVEAQLFLKDREVFLWNGYELQARYTPGHSPDSVCYLLEEKYLFAGDTIFQNEYPMLRFPGGDKDTYYNYTKPIIDSWDGDLLVYPGHGSAFKLSESIVRKELDK